MSCATIPAKQRLVGAWCFYGLLGAIASFSTRDPNLTSDSCSIPFQCHVNHSMMPSRDTVSRPAGSPPCSSITTTCHHVKHQIPFDSRLITIIVPSVHPSIARHLSARLLTNVKSPVTGLNGCGDGGALGENARPSAMERVSLFAISVMS